MTTAALLLAGCSSTSPKPDRTSETRSVIKELGNTMKLLQTMDTYLSQMQENLVKCRGLAVQAANGIYTRSDRKHKNMDFAGHLDEVARITEHAFFNGRPLFNRLDKKWQSGLQIVLDARQPALMFLLPAMDPTVFGTFSTDKKLYTKNNVPLKDGKLLHIATLKKANQSISGIDNCLMKVAEFRSIAGAWKKRLGYALEIQKTLIAGRRKDIRKTVSRIENEVFRLTLRSANGIHSPFDRKMLNQTYTELLLELKRISCTYGVSSGIADFNPGRDNLLTVKGSEALRMKIVKIRGKSQG